MPKDIKVVFLDCDGVLSPLSSHSLFQSDKMNRLKVIVEKTNAVIVLSSSWRESDFGRKEVAKHLEKFEIPKIMDCTPTICGSRAKEILLWIKNCESSGEYRVINFCALDDIDLPMGAPDPEFFKKHAVVTDSEAGLTDADVEKAIDLLRDGNNFC